MNIYVSQGIVKYKNISLVLFFIVIYELLKYDNENMELLIQKFWSPVAEATMKQL